MKRRIGTLIGTLAGAEKHLRKVTWNATRSPNVIDLAGSQRQGCGHHHPRAKSVLRSHVDQRPTFRGEQGPCIPLLFGVGREQGDPRRVPRHIPAGKAEVETLFEDRFQFDQRGLGERVYSRSSRRLSEVLRLRTLPSS